MVLKILMTGSIIAEIIGSIGLGMWLHASSTARTRLLVLTEGVLDRGLPGAVGGPFLVAMAFVGWSFVGFESAGSIAEEVHHPRRNLPKAVIFSITFIAIVVMFSCLAIILAIPAGDRGRGQRRPGLRHPRVPPGRRRRQARRGPVRDRLPGLASWRCRPRRPASSGRTPATTPCRRRTSWPG